jgi:outer membrane protein assembly factor BamB
MRTSTAVAAVAALVVLAVPSSAGSVLPAQTTATTFQGGPAHTGSSPETFSPPLQVRWSRQTPGKVSYPVVAEGRVFVVSEEGSGLRRLRAFDLGTGRLLWLRTLSLGEAPKLAYGAGRLFAVTSNCTVVAMDPRTGGTRWVAKDFAVEYQCVAPLVVRHGRVFLISGAGDGALSVRDATTGAFLWRRRTDSAQFDAPIVTRDRVFASGLIDVRAFALDGTRLWAVECCGFEHGGGTGAYYRGRLYVRYGAGVIDPETGELVGQLASEAAFAFDGDLAFCVGQGDLQAVDLTTGQVVWTHSSTADIEVPPLVVNDVVYVGDRDGQLSAVRIEDGQPVWTAQATDGFRASEVSSQHVGFAAAGGALVAPHGSSMTVYEPTSGS